MPGRGQSTCRPFSFDRTHFTVAGFVRDHPASGPLLRSKMPRIVKKIGEVAQSESSSSALLHLSFPYEPALIHPRKTFIIEKQNYNCILVADSTGRCLSMHHADRASESADERADGGRPTYRTTRPYLTRVEREIAAGERGGLARRSGPINLRANGSWRTTRNSPVRATTHATCALNVRQMRRSSIPSSGPRFRVYRPGRAKLVDQGGREDAVHRARHPLGKPLRPPPIAVPDGVGLPYQTVPFMGVG